MNLTVLEGQSTYFFAEMVIIELIYHKLEGIYESFRYSHFKILKS